MAKYPRYQDYVVRDGKLVGEFEAMYRDYDDPWEQTAKEVAATDKALVLHALQKIGARRVVELGCGLGILTDRIRQLGMDVVGVDTSATAVRRAAKRFPDCRFVAADILDVAAYAAEPPDAICMPEITWYVLDKLDAFLEMFKTRWPQTYLLHTLTTYPPGVQQLGREKFTNLEEILTYFAFDYSEWGEVRSAGYAGSRTWFVGRPKHSAIGAPNTTAAVLR
jgi:SAM-dependent methyltransferase